MDPIFHIVCDMGCRNHVSLMLAGKMEKVCCMCNPTKDCKFEGLDSWERTKKEVKQEREMRRHITDEEYGSYRDSDGKLYRD